MAIATREATADDAAAIALAHTRAWQSAYKDILPADFLAAIDLDARALRWHQNLTETTLPDGTPSPRNFVVEDAGTVVGFACVGVWRGAPQDQTLGELWAIYVHPDSWGSGAGYALMQASESHFRAVGVATAYLWVLEQNGLARRFYERQGWQNDGVAKNETIDRTEVEEVRYSRGLGQKPQSP